MSRDVTCECITSLSESWGQEFAFFVLHSSFLWEEESSGVEIGMLFQVLVPSSKLLELSSAKFKKKSDWGLIIQLLYIVPTESPDY